MKGLMPERYVNFLSERRLQQDNPYDAWAKERNVIDSYKQLSNEQIKSKVQEHTLPFAIMVSQELRDFNYGSVIRAANFLGAREVFHHGYRKFDRRSCVGSYHYTSLNYLSSFQEIFELKKRYIFVALENNLDFQPENLHTFIWPIKPILLVVGEEGAGISKEILNICDRFVEIPGRGSIRSLNLAQATSIAMYDLISKNYL